MDSSEEKTYMSICLLNGSGKLLGRLLLNRLNQEIDKHGELLEKQHGFSERRLTISILAAVKDIADEVTHERYTLRKKYALLTVDVGSVFNSTP